MEKKYVNILVRTPQYRRMLMIMTAIILGMTILVVGLNFLYLSRNKNKMNPEKYRKEESRVKSVVFFQAALATMVVSSMFIIAGVKGKTSITTNTEGLEYRNIFKSVFIPWEKIKNVKIKTAGTSMEKCTVKGEEGKSIAFNAFMLDETIEYKMTKDGVFDEHDNKIKDGIKKSKLYKEISRIHNINVKKRGKKK